jgi:hypothetical protein
MKKLLCVLLVTSSWYLAGQEYNFKPLVASGPLPEAFQSNYLQKLQKAEAKIPKGLEKKDRKLEFEVLQVSEFYLDQFITSGKVIYGDPVTTYLKDVVNFILKNDPKLREEIQVFTVRDAEFNAYMTNAGIMFVNLGLLAELETEAQLAYILSHEIIHYKKRHVLENEKFRKNVEKIKNNKNLDGLSEEELEYAFSREQELEADRLAYTEYFKTSGYSQQAPLELLEIMLYAYLPFDNIPFDFNILKTQAFGILNQDIIDHQATPISAAEDIPDSLSTHPNLLARRNALSELVVQSQGGKDFQVSEERFKSLRTQCRFECLEPFLREREYDRALYQAFLLKQEFPEEPYLKEVIAYSTYATAVYRNHNKTLNKLRKGQLIEGELSRVTFALAEHDQLELNVLAIALTYELWQEQPTSSLARKSFKDAVWEVTHYHEKTLSDFSKSEPVASADSTVSKPKENENLKTGRKVKRIQTEKSNETNAAFNYAFVPYLNDTAFVNMFARQEADMKDYPKRLPKKMVNNKSYNITLKQIREPLQLKDGETLKYPEKPENKGGLDKKDMIILTPRLYSFSWTADINYSKSNILQQQYLDNITKMSKAGGVKATVLDYKDKKNDQERFNDMQQLQLWYDEHDNHSGIDLVHSSYNRVEEVTNRYGTTNLLVLTRLSLSKMGTGESILNLAPAILAPLAAPVVVSQYFISSYQYKEWIQLMDLKTERDVVNGSKSGTNYRQNSVAQAELYDFFKQLSSKPKLVKK